MQETIALVHGWGMPGEVFNPLAQELTESFEVITPKFPGDAGFIYQGEKTIEEFAARIITQISRPTHLLGWSFGGLLSLMIATLKPDLVKSIIMVASTPKFVRDQTWRRGISSDVLQNFAQDLQTNYRKTINKFLALQTMYLPEQYYLLAELKRNIRHKPDIDALKAQLQLLIASDLRHDLKKLPHNILWTLGQKDMLVPAKVSLDIVKLVPGVSMEIINKAGHVPFLSHPAVFAKKVIEWIS